MSAMTSNTVDTGSMKYSSPYKYDVDSVHMDLFPVPTTTVLHPHPHHHHSHQSAKEKHMVKLRPMVKPGHVFQPFMAVP